MRKILKIILYPISLVMFLLILIYKGLISPLLPHACRFTPSCSTYALQAIKEFGPFKGLVIAIKRFSRCTPNGRSGYDPIPLNIKGDMRWLI